MNKTSEPKLDLVANFTLNKPTETFFVADTKNQVTPLQKYNIVLLYFR